jgi:hypothetical protein
MPVVIFVLVVAFTALLMKLAFALTIFALFASVVFYIARIRICTPSVTERAISTNQHKNSDILGRF